MKADPENLLKNLLMLRDWMNKQKKPKNQKKLYKILSLKWKVTETP